MHTRLKDVARAAGVSEATASLALNNKKVIKEETKKRVREAADKLGYAPNAIAQGLAKRRSKAIGLIVPDIESAYYGKLVRCVDSEVRKAGYDLLLAISNDDPAVERHIVDRFITQRLEGVLIAPIHQYSENPEQVIKKLGRHGIYCVFITSYYPQADAACVMADLEKGMFELVDYLISLGHRKIVFVAGTRRNVAISHRLQGYIKAFDKNHLKYDDRNIFEYRKLNYDDGYEAAGRLMKQGSKVELKADAVVCINDSVALGVINAFKNSGIRIPEDISVAGFDDVIFSITSPVPITTVHQDMEEISSKAVELLLNQIRDNKVCKDRILTETKLILRDSTMRKRRI